MELIEPLRNWLTTHEHTWSVVVLLGTLLLSLATRFVFARLVRRAGRNTTPWDEAIIDALGPPLRLFIWIVGLTIAFRLSGFEVEETVHRAVRQARNIGIIAATSWFMLRMVNRGHDILVAQGEQDDESNSYDVSAVDATAKLLKLVVAIAAALAIMQTAGVSIAGVLTFGGIGGIAVGFAAKDLLANFFGGLMIYLDKPFKLGDWIKSPDRELEGVVEQIGWRITVIRNFENRPLYVPNATFSTIAIENVSRMTNRRIYETIGVRYDDGTRLDDIVSEVTAYLKEHEEIDQSQTLLVTFTAFGPSSLDFFVYCYTKTVSGPRYWRVKQQVLLDILGIIEKNGAECAFPTTTLHIASGALPAAGGSSGEAGAPDNPDSAT